LRTTAVFLQSFSRTSNALLLPTSAANFRRECSWVNRALPGRGFWRGGLPTFGLRRQLINVAGEVRNPATFDILRKLKTPRQIEACELMVAGSKYSSSYAKALLAATKDEDRVKPAKPLYGRDMLDLVISAR
jgi:hypothetical protein